MTRRGEFDLIASLFAPLSDEEHGLGLRDDAARLRPDPGHDLIVTTDALVAGVHFFAEDSPADIARKALRVNLSDVAAKGAVPRFYLLDLALPDSIDDAWLEGFAAGLGSDRDAYGVILIGGDTVSTPGPLTLAITAFGQVRQGMGLHRNAAHSGDRIFVTGSVGDAALGLRVRRGELDMLAAPARDALRRRYLLPEPRTTVGPRLVALAHAAMDVSDGLVGDLGHICRASGLGAEIVADMVPHSAAVRAALAMDPRLRDAVLTGGDDYEILFTAPAHAAPALAEIAAETGVPITEIGRMGAGDKVTVWGDEGRPLHFASPGHRHF